MFRISMSICLIAMTAQMPRQVGADDRPAKPLETKDQIAKLIRELGADAQKDRERAERELLKLPEAIPELRKNLNSRDSEIARRASRIVRKLLVESFESQIKTDALDLFVERFIHSKDPLEREAGWQAIINLGRSLTENEKRHYGKMEPGKIGPWRDFNEWIESRTKLKETTKPDGEAEASLVDGEPKTDLIRAQSVFVKSIAAGMFITSRGVQGGGLTSSVVIAGDSINVHHIGGSIIICDGDIETQGIRDSIVIARGEIKSGFLPISSFVVCSGPFKPRNKTPDSPMTLKDNSANLLGLVKFFETSQVGVEVAGDEGGVKVTRISEGKPFARAGLKSNDLILSLGGIPANSVGAFRRSLRTKVALNQPAILQVRRDGKEIEIKVTFGE
jgi:PDZ domain-containing protein